MCRIGILLVVLLWLTPLEQTPGPTMPLPTKPVLTLDVARRVAAAAEAEAARNNWAVAIAVLDDAGHLVVFHRMDGAKLVAIDIAIRKARTAVYFQGPTKALEEEVAAAGRRCCRSTVSCRWKVVCR